MTPPPSGVEHAVLFRFVGEVMLLDSAQHLNARSELTQIASPPCISLPSHQASRNDEPLRGERMHSAKRLSSAQHQQPLAEFFYIVQER